MWHSGQGLIPYTMIGFDDEEVFMCVVLVAISILWFSGNLLLVTRGECWSGIGTNSCERIGSSNSSFVCAPLRKELRLHRYLVRTRAASDNSSCLDGLHVRIGQKDLHL